MDTTSEEEHKNDGNLKDDTKDRSAPSGYRLAAHRYMVAKKQGLIKGPSARTQALKITKTSQEPSEDSVVTIDYLSDSAPTHKKRKREKSTPSQGTLVTKTFVLKKDGKGTKLPKKPTQSEGGNIFLNA